MTDDHDVQRIFVLCADVERTMAELYQHLAQVHRPREELSRLWAKTAREEENHARQFELAGTMHEAVAEVCISCDQADGLLRGVQQVLAEVRAQPLAAVAALEKAVRLEQRMASFHLSNVTTFAQPAVRKLFEAMLAADRDHIAALERQLELERARE